MADLFFYMCVRHILIQTITLIKNHVHILSISSICIVQVVIYSKTYCPYCTRTKSLFQSEFPDKNVKVFELDRMEEGSSIQSDLQEMTGQRTVPSVWVKGNFVGGNDDTMALFRSGNLSEMLSV